MPHERRLLVFGGTGFLGRRILTHMPANWSVDATHLSSPIPASAARGVRWHRTDITNVDEVAAAMSSVRPTHVVNAAYRQGGDDVSAVCATAPKIMAELAADSDAGFIQVSTDLVFDGELSRPYIETDAVSPLGAYGEAKAEAEGFVADAHPQAAIVRTSLIYGSPTAPQERLTVRAVDDGDIAFFTDEWRTPVHVDDLASAIIHLLHTEHAGLIHVAGTERLNRLEFAQRLAPTLHRSPAALVGRTQDPALGPRAKDVSLNTDLSAGLGLVLPGPTRRLGTT